MVMRKHQRYFPIYASDAPDAPLLPYFITVANGPVNEEAVVQGNQAVLRARFEDATFFYTEDLKTTLEQLVPRLQGTMFQQQLGTLLDKTNRVHALITPLAPALGLGDAQDTAATVARLARADLASSTVMEMTALAGVMGRHYALKQGLGEEIAQGVFESVLPRQAGDVLPSSPAGILGAIADRVDSLVGLFAAGCAPTASADPYGLRRIAYGMLQVWLWVGGWVGGWVGFMGVLGVCVTGVYCVCNVVDCQGEEGVMYTQDDESEDTLMIITHTQLTPTTQAQSPSYPHNMHTTQIHTQVTPHPRTIHPPTHNIHTQYKHTHNTHTHTQTAVANNVTMDLKEVLSLAAAQQPIQVTEVCV